MKPLTTANSLFAVFFFFWGFLTFWFFFSTNWSWSLSTSGARVSLDNSSLFVGPNSSTWAQLWAFLHHNELFPSGEDIHVNRRSDFTQTYNFFHTIITWHSFETELHLHFWDNLWCTMCACSMENLQHLAWIHMNPFLCMECSGVQDWWHQSADLIRLQFWILQQLNDVQSFWIFIHLLNLLNHFGVIGSWSLS